MPVNSTSSVSLAAMPVAGQVPGTGARSRVSAVNSRVPSGAAAVTRACVHVRAPEQYRLMPSSRHPPAVRLAISPGPGGCAAQTPQRLPAAGAPAPSSARMASASVWPLDSRARDRSSPASSARTAQRSQVRPPPGSGRSSRPDPIAAAKAAATSLIIVIPRPPLRGQHRCPQPSGLNPASGSSGDRRRKARPVRPEIFRPDVVSPCLRTALTLLGAGGLGALGGRLLGAGVCGGMRSVGSLEVGADEPVELLELAGLPDEHVLGHLVELLGGVDGPAVRLDDPGVHHVQSAEMLQGAGPADGVVVPV